MTHHLVDWLRTALVDYGYWAVAAILLLENLGLPVPGETVLLLASFLAYTKHELQLSWIICVGTVATTLGGCLGYWVGHRAGRPVLERYQTIFRVQTSTLMRGEKLFERYGAAAVLFARFVFGLRVIAGPLAGILRMPWSSFALFNFVGASLWVTAISLVGFFFGSRWSRLVRLSNRFDLVLAVVFVFVVLAIWWRNRQVERHF
jgi:membrane protein DedA with SNARE-associated domain